MRLVATALVALAVAIIPAGRVTADENDRAERAVTAWAQDNAHPLATLDPNASLSDLEPLRRLVDDATIVGLGESSHGAAEEIALKQRVLRFLVEQLGFRSIAWEEDWTTGLEINEYIRGGAGNADELVARMSPQYQSAAVGDVLRRLRSFNAGRDDPVQFVGVEYYFTRQPTYDTVRAYVTDAAPERLDELRAHLDPIEPTDPDPFQNIENYMNVGNKQAYVDHAHAVHDIVMSIGHEPRERVYELALHASQQIISFYKHYRMDPADSDMYREVRAARSVRWWQRLTGDRVAYWAATPHTANARDLRIAQPPAPDIRFRSAGSYLRDWYRSGYASIGFTLDHGAIAAGPGMAVPLPPSSSEWFEHPLGDVRYDQFILDLHQRAPRPVRTWLHGRTLTRGPGPGSYVTGVSVANWFDVLVHRQEVSAA